MSGSNAEGCEDLIVCEEKTYTFPVSAQNDVSITTIFPMLESDWDYFMETFKAMKPGLVRNT